MKPLLKTIPMALPLFAIVLTLVLLTITRSSEAKTITTLPGYNGNFDFSLETGYVGVGENKEVQLFYYFAESERNSSEDPLLIWITGGPGCSSAVGFFFQSGPLTFVIEEYDGSLPKLQLNHHRWTKELNILYLDVPVGAGFSYTQSNEDPERSDDSLVAHTYEFIQKWLQAHPTFSNSDLYLGGDGYSGKPVTVIVQTILNGNEAGNDTHINIKGYVIGNPGTDNSIDFNAQTTFAHRIGFVPDQLYESAVENCGGNFTTETPSEACTTDLTAINGLLTNINWIQVLEPTCSNVTNDPFDQSDSAETYLELDNLAYDPLVAYSGRRYLDEKRVDGHPWCRNYNHKLCATWANNAQVQAALGVPSGAVSKWQYCNDVNYNRQITSVVDYHKGFSKYNIRALIYSGDHDISIPYIATQKWIDSLGLTETQSWRLWTIHNENAGYTRRFKENDYELTYATIKGGGHFAAETNVEECSVMVSRWMAYSDL